MTKPSTGPEQLRRTVPANAEQLIGLRRALAGWVAETALPETLREELVLATYEAMANSAEHAYAGRTDGVLELRADADTDTVTVTVADRGTWRPPKAGDSVRGRGLMLIKGLSHRSEVTHGETGTTVTMTWHLPAAT